MENQRRVGRGIELIEGLGFEDVRGRLLRIGEVDESANRGLAFYLADIAARRLYEDGGYSSAVHFAEAQLEMNARRARELIQVGRELASLELVDDAFFAAEIGWTKVLLLLRVVQIGTQEVWVEFARSVSCRELDDEVRRCRPGELPGAGSRIGLNAHHHPVSAKLDDKNFAALEKAREFCIERSGREGMTDSELLIALTKTFAIHHDLDLEEESASRLPPEDRNHDEIPSEIRQLVMARDRHRCRNCHSYRDPQIHHITPREQGGSNDPENLVVLCSTCHGLVHSDKLCIEGSPSSAHTLTFLSANGTPVTRQPAHPRGGRPPLSDIPHPYAAADSPRLPLSPSRRSP